MVADFSNLPTYLNQVNEMTFLKVKNIFSKPGGIESHLGPKQAPRPLSIKQKDCFPIADFPAVFFFIWLWHWGMGPSVRHVLGVLE